LAGNERNQPPGTVRAFIAVRVDDAVEQAVAALVDELKAGRGEGVRWVRRGNLHLTLKFLGPAVPIGKLEPLKTMLERVAAEAEPFDLAVHGVGGFPSLERPRVIWVGLEGAGLQHLAKRVEEAAARCGFEPERRPFTGHLTIGRVNSYRGFEKTRRALSVVAERDFGRSRIDALTLYRSTLTPEGPVYEPLARYELGGAAA
jgi:2'-5' RNA ligase